MLRIQAAGAAPVAKRGVVDHRGGNAGRTARPDLEPQEYPLRFCGRPHIRRAHHSASDRRSAPRLALLKTGNRTGNVAAGREPLPVVRDVAHRPIQCLLEPLIRKRAERFRSGALQREELPVVPARSRTDQPAEAEETGLFQLRSWPGIGGRRGSRPSIGETRRSFPRTGGSRSTATALHRSFHAFSAMGGIFRDGRRQRGRAIRYGPSIRAAE